MPTCGRGDGCCLYCTVSKIRLRPATRISIAVIFFFFIRLQEAPTCLSFFGKEARMWLATKSLSAGQEMQIKARDSLRFFFFILYSRRFGFIFMNHLKIPPRSGFLNLAFLPLREQRVRENSLSENVSNIIKLKRTNDWKIILTYSRKCQRTSRHVRRHLDKPDEYKIVIFFVIPSRIVYHRFHNNKK